eukprot:TRINITY_DN10983_c2_g1_i1.p1 TRINITY_DN10983_c2_g1~~TRINITY_DN10983_c2_g1_i1.p1  ORF type:complete len:382 (-),score=77.55 TRINITY_DN10983_c2_g1_i1:370-1485(-)
MSDANPCRRLHILAQHCVPKRKGEVLSLQSTASGEDVDLDALAYGFMASQALFAALELGVFDKLEASQPMTAESLAAACGLKSNQLQTLLTALVAAKCMTRDGASKTYCNSPNVSNFMVTSSKNYYGDYFKYQMGRLFYNRMSHLAAVMKGEEDLDYSTWFADPAVASLYTSAQHNGSLATAKSLFRKVPLNGVSKLLDVGGGSGAFSLQAARMTPGLKATVLEFPEVCKQGRRLLAAEAGPEEKDRVQFVELDATSPHWPVEASSQEVVLMSYLSGSVPEALISQLYGNAMRALKPGGKLIVHDFMVDDTKDGPALGAYWALQHVTVNPNGLGLAPAEISDRMRAVGFKKTEHFEMIDRMTKVVIGWKAV